MFSFVCAMMSVLCNYFTALIHNFAYLTALTIHNDLLSMNWMCFNHLYVCYVFPYFFVLCVLKVHCSYIEICIL